MNISKNEWVRIEAPLLEFDEFLKNFAKLHKMKLTKNYHEWPERSLEWNKNNIRRLIQLWIENDENISFNFWICASQDRLGKRYWKNKYLKEKASFFDIKSSIDELLKKGFEILESWDRNDLELVTNQNKEHL